MKRITNVNLSGLHLLELPPFLEEIDLICGYFNISHNRLTSINLCPKKVDTFNCSFNQLTSLLGTPKVNTSFNCSENKLTSLKGCPKRLNGRFDCTNNQLTSLEGGPEYVNGDYCCYSNPLETLKGIPKIIGGDFIYPWNSKNWSKGYIRSLSKIKGDIIRLNEFFEEDEVDPWHRDIEGNLDP